MTKKPKLVYSIKGKLVSAVCMLLVAMIMVVSSTYAWFTLSTAPEITGISTAVGANGALEIILNNETGAYNYGIIAADEPATERNKYWGNILDLSSGYGLDQIVLNPASLNLVGTDTNNAALFGSTVLKTPVYGADGRVSELDDNTVTGTFDTDKGNFMPNNKLGVRAVGRSTGMSARELTLRNARSAASTAMGQAKKVASNSLNTNGSTLANIALKKGTEGDAARYTTAEVNSLKAIVTDLLGKTGTTGILEYIETAYLQYIIAYAADEDSELEDLEVEALKTYVEANSFSDIITQNAEDKYVLTVGETEVVLPDALQTSVGKLIATRATVDTARTQLEAITDTEVTWAQLSGPLHLLADPDEMKVNGIKAGEVMDNAGDLASSVVANGLTVSIATGGGVYADIADHCGDYNASIVIAEINYGGVSLKNQGARMETKTEQNPPYLQAFASVAQGFSAPPTAAGESPISEFYGYIIDFAFQTNAPESNLLLQQDAIDRIYGEDNANEATQGKGSYMEFNPTTTDFSLKQVQDLMKSIRIVFFTPGTDNNTVLVYAKLDVANGENTANGGWKAPVYLYEMVKAKQYRVVTEVNDDALTYGDPVNYYERVTTPDDPATDGVDETVIEYFTTYSGNEKVSADIAAKIQAAAAPAQVGDLQLLAEVDAENRLEIITALPQNTPTAVSALVYLDGESITNASVAATASTSVTGTMNLQFASDANLVPMDYGELQVPAYETVELGELDLYGTKTAEIDVTGAATVEVENTQICSASAIADSKVTLTGLKVGETSVVAKDASGKIIKKWNVVVVDSTPANP